MVPVIGRFTPQKSDTVSEGSCETVAFNPAWRNHQMVAAQSYEIIYEITSGCLYY